jgi:hypothetical protein
MSGDLQFAELLHLVYIDISTVLWQFCIIESDYAGGFLRP